MKDVNYYYTWDKQDQDYILDVVKTLDFEIVTSGKKLIDLSSISGQSIFGFKDNVIKKKIKQQLNELPIMSPKANFTLKKNVTKDLLHFLSKDAINKSIREYIKNGKIFYTTSGSESIENALKIARQISNKKIILARKKSYHGATLGSMSISGDWRSQEHLSLKRYTKFIPDFFEDPTLEKTKKIIKSLDPKNIAAICLETFTAVNGVYFAPKKWIEQLCMFCNENSILIILDEVYCGFYRSGKPFCFNYYNIKPDFVCMAKGITAGYIPLGALWTSNEIFNNFRHKILSCGLTNYAHPLGLSALEGVLENFNNDKYKLAILRNIELLDSYIKTEFSKLESVKEVRHKGLMACIVLKNKNIKINTYYDYGLYLIIRDNTIILSPPLNIKPTLFKKGLNILIKIIGSYNAK
jgi:taurine---2-oxoglutarate transaminase